MLRLIARGRSYAEIGAELCLAELTVKARVTQMLAKLGLRDRSTPRTLGDAHPAAVRVGIAHDSVRVHEH